MQPAQIELFHSYDGTEQRIASAVTIASANASDMTNDSYIFKATPENGWDIVSSNVPKVCCFVIAIVLEGHELHIAHYVLLCCIL